MAVTSDQIARLPKWARDHIAALDRQRVGAQSRLDAYLDGVPESRVLHDPYADMHARGGRPLPLDERVPVEFRLSDGVRDARVHAKFQRDHRGVPYIEVASTDQTLTVEPQAANVVRVSVRAR